MIITKSTPFIKEEIRKLHRPHKYKNNKTLIESLSMDLMRVALSYQKGSIKTAQRFSEEALIGISEIQISKVKPYFAKILKNIDSCLSNQPKERTAEDALMYSTLCRNYAQKYP